MGFLRYSILLIAFTAFGAEFYVSPTGTGDGSIVNPWGIHVALTNSGVHAGDTIYFRGGTYDTYNTIWPGTAECKLVGATNNPITLRKYPGERPILDGGINCKNPSDWVTFRDLEFTCSRARTNVYMNRPMALGMSARGHKVINCVFANTGQSSIGGGGSEVYGCIAWGCGIFEYEYETNLPTVWVRGSTFYLQNNSTEPYLVTDNICRGAFSAGMKAYGQNAQVQNFVLDGNVVLLNNGESIEVECTENTISNAWVVNNYMYRNGKTPIGYFTPGGSLPGHGSAVYTNNYCYSSPGVGASAVWFYRWTNFTALGNTIVTTSVTNEWLRGSGVGAGMAGQFLSVYPATNSSGTYIINSNAYYGGVEQSGNWNDVGSLSQGKYQPFRWNANSAPVPEDGTNGRLQFVSWTNSHGFDVNSAYTTNMPTANVVAVRTNKYEQGRAHIVVYNWESNNTATVDFTQIGLTNGQPFEVRDAQNFLGAAAVTGTFSASSPNVELPLTLTDTSGAEVTGVDGYYTFDPNVHTASLFNVFVVLPTAAPVTRYTHTHGSGTLGSSTR